MFRVRLKKPSEPVSYFVYVICETHVVLERNPQVLCNPHILQDESMQFLFKVHWYTSPCECKDLAFPWVKLHAPPLLPLL